MSDRDISREDCLEAIRELAEELGHSPKKAEFAEADSTPSVSKVTKETGLPYTEARSAAGLEPPHDVDQRKVELNVDYFAEITTPDRAYWLGTLFAQSARTGADDSTALMISHTEKNRHFVEGLHRAIGAGYVISTVERVGEQDRVQFILSNSQFIENLERQGLDDSGKNVPELPNLPEDLRPHFLRGLFEVRGRITDGAFAMSAGHRERLETAAQWIEDLGIKRVHVSELQSGRFNLRVSSVFDVATLFEACWTELADDSIRSDRIYREAREDICKEHQFPENLNFCGEADEEETSSGGTDEAGRSDTEDQSETEEDEDGHAGDFAVTVPSALVFSLTRAVDDGEPTEVVGRCLERYLQSLLGDQYPDTPVVPVDDESSVTVDLDVVRPVEVAVAALVDDGESPFESLSELVTTAVVVESPDFDPDGRRLDVDPTTAALLKEVGDGDTTDGAAAVVSKLASEQL